MRIGIISGMWQTVPPPRYGGIERAVYNLAEALLHMGDDVVLFAPKGSKFKGKCVEISNRVFIDSPGNLIAHIKCWRNILDANKCDVYHNHGRIWNIPFILNILRKPCVHTFHSLIKLSSIKILQNLFSANKIQLAALSYAQIKPFQGYLEPAYWNVVYYGIDIAKIPFYEIPKTKPYLAFVGRVSPEKGTDIAIDIAHKTGVPLVIAGPLQPHNIAFFKEKIEPRIDGRMIDYIGEIDEFKQYEIFGNALATLFPIIWNEPFGLVLLYSLAAGTPVIAFDKGATREIIKNGINGFIVNSVEDASKRIKEISLISRLSCRKTIDEHFTSAIMAQNYRRLYSKILQ